MTMKRLFIEFCLAFLLLFGCSTEAMEPSKLMNCVPLAEVAIDGYVPGQNMRMAARKPDPIETVESKGEDDGGVYTETIQIYDLYQVGIVRETVDSVITSSPNVSWAEEIKIGDARSRVDSRIGYAQVSESKDEAQYLVCSDSSSIYAILHFKSNKLAIIEVAQDRP